MMPDSWKQEISEGAIALSPAPAKPRSPGNSVEAGILIASARVASDDATVRSLRDLIQSPVCWAELVAAAALHGTAPLLYHNLSRYAADLVPEPTIAELRRKSLYSLANNSILMKTLAGVLALLEQSGVRAIPYKGVMLAGPVYGNLGLRETVDLDILVRPDDYDPARNLLLSQGYTPLARFDLGWECHFSSPANGVVIDVHQAVLPSWFGVTIPFDPIHERCAPVTIAGSTFPNLSAEDCLLLLCLQVFKDTAHGRLCLRQVCDVNEVLRNRTDIDWEGLLRRARTWGVHRQLCLGLEIARETLTTPVPADLRTLIAREESLPLFVEQATRLLRDTSRSETHPFYTGFLEHWFLVQWQRTTTEKAWMIVLALLRLVRTCSMPTDKERELLPLPARLSFAYYLIRPVRLSAKYTVQRPLRWSVGKLKRAFERPGDAPPD